MKSTLLVLVSILLLSMKPGNSFLASQSKNARVKTALTEKQKSLEAELRKRDIALNEMHLLFIVYKAEKELVAFAKRKTDSVYKPLKIYPICASSGTLGPKSKAGDSQVPEGLYTISKFNPNSTYHLSLQVSYPNAADKIRSQAKDLGGDIFIHGACVTIGCLPMTDDGIKELYSLAVHATNNGQKKIPVYIFPFQMTDINMSRFQKEMPEVPGLMGFWFNLKKGMDSFLTNYKELKYTIDSNGMYQFK